MCGAYLSVQRTLTLPRVSTTLSDLQRTFSFCKDDAIFMSDNVTCGVQEAGQSDRRLKEEHSHTHCRWQTLGDESDS